MITLGLVLLIVGILIEFLPLTGGWYHGYRYYGGGLGGLLIVAGIVLIVIGYLHP